MNFWRIEQWDTKPKKNDRVIYDAYVGYDPITKKQRRFQNKSLSKVKQDVEQFFAAIKSCGDFGVLLKPYEAVDARRAFDLLYAAKCGKTLEQVVREHLGCQVKAVGKGLGEAYDEYLTTIPEERALHRGTVASRVGKFVELLGRNIPITEVTSGMVTGWITEHYSNPKTYNNHLSYIKTFFNWYTKKSVGYLSENPISDESLKAIVYKEPEYLSTQDARRLFEILEKEKETHPEFIIYATLSFCCGIRREEILRMASMPDAARVCIEDETIRISKPKGWTRGIMPRHFSTQENALAWLKSVPYDENIAKVTKWTTEQVYDLAAKNGIKMPKNAGRHTFITMHVAKYGDPAKTEAIAGTSRKMRVSNYAGFFISSHKIV